MAEAWHSRMGAHRRAWRGVDKTQPAVACVAVWPSPSRQRSTAVGDQYLHLPLCPESAVASVRQDIKMKQVIGISLGERQQDFAFRTPCLARSCRCVASAPTATPAEAGRLLRHWDSRADAIGLGLAKDSGNLADGGPDPRRAARLRAKVNQAPFSNGARLADILLEWAVRHAQATLGHYFDNARVLFFSGLAHQKLAMAMAEYTPNLHFADPVLQFGSPKLLTSLDALGLYASGMHYVADWVPRRAGQRPADGAVGAARAAPRRLPCHGAGGPGAPARRPGPGGTGRQDGPHPHRQRGAAGGLQGQGRAPGDRRRAAAAGPCDRPFAVRCDAAGRHRPPRRRSARRRLPGDPRQRRPAAAPAVPQRVQAREPLRLRHPPAVAGVLQEGQAGGGAVARVAAAADGLAGEGDGLRATLRLLAGSRASARPRASRPKAG